MLNKKQLQTAAGAFFTYVLTSSEVREKLCRAVREKDRKALLDLINARLGLEPPLTEADLLPFFQALQRIGVIAKKEIVKTYEVEVQSCISLKPGAAGFLQGEGNDG